MSLSDSHTVSFLGALEHHCVGPAGTQPDVPKNDPCWKRITEGWSWVVLSSEIEDHIPAFPSWLQMAMNSSNSIGRPQTELGLATTMATFFQNGMDLHEAIAKAKQGDIKCQQSLPAVAHYVQRFAGGPNFPLVHFLGKFGKQFGGTLLLGGDFFHALAHTDFKVSGQTVPMVRMDIWATMLTNPQRSQDGFAKVFSKGDIEKLKGHGCIEKTKEAETMLAKAWETYLHMVATNSKMELHYTKCFGKFTVRLMFFLTQKQKMPKETKSRDSLHDILAALTQEVQIPPTSSSTGPGEPTTAVALEVKDMLKASPKEVAQLQNHHLKIEALHLGISVGKLFFKVFFF
jgi:hypothetical protein